MTQTERERFRRRLEQERAAILKQLGTLRGQLIEDEEIDEMQMKDYVRIALNAEIGATCSSEQISRWVSVQWFYHMSARWRCIRLFLLPVRVHTQRQSQWQIPEPWPSVLA